MSAELNININVNDDDARPDAPPSSPAPMPPPAAPTPPEKIDPRVEYAKAQHALERAAGLVKSEWPADDKEIEGLFVDLYAAGYKDRAVQEPRAAESAAEKAISMPPPMDPAAPVAEDAVSPERAAAAEPMATEREREAEPSGAEAAPVPPTQITPPAVPPIPPQTPPAAVQLPAPIPAATPYMEGPEAPPPVQLKAPVVAPIPPQAPPPPVQLPQPIPAHVPFPKPMPPPDAGLDDIAGLFGIEFSPLDRGADRPTAADDSLRARAAERLRRMEEEKAIDKEMRDLDPEYRARQELRDAYADNASEIRALTEERREERLALERMSPEERIEYLAQKEARRRDESAAVKARADELAPPPVDPKAEQRERDREAREAAHLMAMGGAAIGGKVGRMMGIMSQLMASPAIMQQFGGWFSGQTREKAPVMAPPKYPVAMAAPEERDIPVALHAPPDAGDYAPVALPAPPEATAPVVPPETDVPPAQMGDTRPPRGTATVQGTMPDMATMEAITEAMAGTREKIPVALYAPPEAGSYAPVAQPAPPDKGPAAQMGDMRPPRGDAKAQSTIPDAAAMEGLASAFGKGGGAAGQGAGAAAGGGAAGGGMTGFMAQAGAAIPVVGAAVAAAELIKGAMAEEGQKIGASVRGNFDRAQAVLSLDEQQRMESLAEAHGAVLDKAAEVVPVFGLLTPAAKEFVNGIVMMNRQVEQTANRLAEYSGPLAAQQAEHEVLRTLRDIERANRFGATIARTNEARFRMEERMAALMDRFVPFIMKWAEDLFVFLEHVFKGADIVAENQLKHLDMLVTIGHGLVKGLGLDNQILNDVVKEIRDRIIQAMGGNQHDPRLWDQFTQMGNPLLGVNPADVGNAPGPAIVAP